MEIISLYKPGEIVVPLIEHSLDTAILVSVPIVDNIDEFECKSNVNHMSLNKRYAIGSYWDQNFAFASEDKKHRNDVLLGNLIALNYHGRLYFVDPVVIKKTKVALNIIMDEKMFYTDSFVKKTGFDAIVLYAFAKSNVISSVGRKKWLGSKDIMARITENHTDRWPKHNELDDIYSVCAVNKKTTELIYTYKKLKKKEYRFTVASRKAFALEALKMVYHVTHDLFLVEWDSLVKLITLQIKQQAEPGFCPNNSLIEQELMQSFCYLQEQKEIVFFSDTYDRFYVGTKFAEDNGISKFSILSKSLCIENNYIVEWELFKQPYDVDPLDPHYIDREKFDLLTLGLSNYRPDIIFECSPGLYFYRIAF